MSENHTDAMVARLDKEIAERNAFIQGTVANAQDAERDLTKNENELITEARKRIEVCEEQLVSLHAANDSTRRARQRADDVQKAITEMRYQVDKGVVEYRSAGAFLRDQYLSIAGQGSERREAQQRLEMRAAAHIKTTDVAGVIPDPIVGEVINFIDASRPLVTVIGTNPITSSTWHRPVVTQHTSVALQGSAGAPADEKAELVSQKMIITDLDGAAQTLGGYVNVSRQTIDFGPGLDFVIEDLAAMYAQQTEELVADELAATATTAVGYGASPTAATVAAAIWTAVGTVFGVTKGRGRLVLAVAPDRLGVFGGLFAPVNPQNAQSQGFNASGFGSGLMGQISGVDVVMSAGLDSGQAFVFSTAAVELFEQRVGALQVTEPSVLGTQVAYAGYFDALTINDDAIVPLTAT